MNRTVQSNSAVSVLELLIVMTLFSTVLLAGYQVFRLVFQQGHKQDQRTTAWLTYCRFSEYLRRDMSRALKVDILSPQELEIETIVLGPNLERVQRKVNYRSDGEKAISRSEGIFQTKFDFSSVLARGEKVNLEISPIP